MRTLIVLMLSAASVYAADITGTVLLPNGQPAAGAQVALAVTGYPLNLGRAKMQGNHGAKSPLVVTDREGHFSLPPNESASAIVAVDDAGCAQVERKEFENGSTIRLEPWGQIEGVLRIGTRLGTNQQVVLGAAGARFFLELEAFQDRTDREGRFVFTCVPPGTWNVSHGGEPFWDGDPVTVRAGETNHVTIGGTGRPVTGKVLISATVTNPPNQASLPPSRLYVKFSDSTRNQTVSYSVHATLYGAGRELAAQMALDGTFRVEDVTAGTWGLLVDILCVPAGGGNAKTIGTAGKTVVVSEIPGGRSDEPLELGTLEPVLVHSPQIGEAAPTLEVATVGGGTFKLADHRGQYVLLDFEPMNWRDQTNQSVQAAWAAFGKSNRLATLTLRVPPTSSYVRSPGADADYPWPLARLWELPWYKLKPLRASFGLQCDRSIAADPNLPAVLLVGPDGRIAARGLQGDAIKAAVAKALGEE